MKARATAVKASAPAPAIDPAFLTVRMRRELMNTQAEALQKLGTALDMCFLAANGAVRLPDGCAFDMEAAMFILRDSLQAARELYWGGCLSDLETTLVGAELDETERNKQEWWVRATLAARGRKA